MKKEQKEMLEILAKIQAGHNEAWQRLESSDTFLDAVSQMEEYINNLKHPDVKTLEVPLSNGGSLFSEAYNTDYPGVEICYRAPKGTEHRLVLVENEGTDYDPDGIRIYVYANPIDQNEPLAPVILSRSNLEKEYDVK